MISRSDSAYAGARFATGRGWRYELAGGEEEGGAAAPRRVRARGDVAWFSEELRNEHLGRCRGSGVCLRGGDGTWRVAQYCLGMAIPNDAALEVAAMCARVAPAWRHGQSRAMKLGYG